MSLIKNREELCAENTELRKDALQILEAGLEAVNTEKVLREKISFHNGVFCLEAFVQTGVGFQCQFYERIFFIGIGKCALDGARVMEEILGEQLTDGIVLDVKAGVLDKIKSYAGTHPYPSAVNMGVTEQILEMVKNVTERDLVIVLISGGGSALLCMPHDTNCTALAEITEALTKKGANIYELNTVRKHLSEVQGGGLAKILFPAQVVSLIFSDVLGNDLSIIASGPTVLDTTTIEDAAKILEKYDVRLPSSSHGEELGVRSTELLETPKEEKYFKKVSNLLIVSNHDALVAMQKQAENLGFNARIESEALQGEAREVGANLAKMEMALRSCRLFGGETTVKINGSGVGGRNQELALAALPVVSEGSLLVAVASDGWDNTEATGAMADKNFYKKAEEIGLDADDFLRRSDSHNFWKQIGGAIYTGRLGSNVSDLVIILNGKQ